MQWHIGLPGKRCAFKSSSACGDGEFRAEHVGILRLADGTYVGKGAKAFFHEMTCCEPGAGRFVGGHSRDGATVGALPGDIYRRQTAAAQGTFLRTVNQPQDDPVAPPTARQVHGFQQSTRLDVEIPRAMLACVIRHASQ